MLNAKPTEYGNLFEPMFKDVVTLDPRRSEEVWEKLSTDTQMLEIGSIIPLLTLAFYDTLCERNLIDGSAPKNKKTKIAKSR